MKRNMLILNIILGFFILSCDSGRSHDLGDGYILYYHARGGLYSITDSTHLVLIGYNIKGFYFNSNYILADQELSDFFGILIDSLQHHMTYEVNKEDIKKSKFHQFWIIDKAKHNVYGPFRKGEFYIKMKELGISDSLELTPL